MFVDEARIKVKAGRGGNGAVSFHREKFRPKGGPDGGAGGRGGSVVLVADEGLNSLNWLRDHPHQSAAAGGSGAGNNRTGADAEDLELKVPAGTVVKDEDATLLADLASPGDRFIAARGGRGGRGNAAFLSGKRRAPGFSEHGEPGEERWLRLELRLVADVAVIGFPNAGKSTLVGAVSRARPKIADYPFTTLEPQLGVVEVGDERFTICDIPGLIEGAHEGKGLGLQFLRHAERAPIFVHLLDAAAGRDPLDDYNIVRQELVHFRRELAERAEVAALNKIDVADPDEVQAAIARLKQAGIQPLAISAKNGEGLQALVRQLLELVKVARSQRQDQSFELFRTEPDAPTVTREGEAQGRTAQGRTAWRIRGRAIERWVAMTDLSNPEGLAYLQTRLERAGVERLMAKAGVREGDEVRIGDAVLEWRP